MKTIILLILFFSMSAFACPRPWVCENVKMPVPYSTVTGVKLSFSFIRAGYLPHKGTFKGNIIYYQGLGDSMLNHDPLFGKLASAGYRVIAFDYMGQGGSTGSMNRTRIEYIPWIGERIWKKFAINLSSFPQKTILGWSTGGLAAYLSASQNRVDKVILIAPGIAPRKIVGEGIWNDIPNEITLESLTTDHYYGQEVNPHREKIKPNSPVKVPLFSLNLLKTAHEMEKKKIPSRVKGFVLLSGKEDTYVNAMKTRQILRKNAAHIKIKSYEGALHEIDNERREIREVAHNDILTFLKSR